MSREISWQQIVQEGDPDWAFEANRPGIYRFSNGRGFRRPANIYADFALDFWNDGGVLAFVSAATAATYPASPSGLLPGKVWNNGLTLGIVPGSVLNPKFIPVFFPRTGSDYFLAHGAADLPQAPPAMGSLQLWNDGGLICIA